MVLASGCFEANVSRSSTSLTCSGDECEACVGEECTPCERGADCDACLEGECLPVNTTAAAPPEDVSIQERHSLVQGLRETTWTFAVAAGATGHARWTIADLATKSVTLHAAYCLQWSIEGPNVNSDGGQGHCNGGVVSAASGTTTDQPLVIREWTELAAGQYRVTVSAFEQANELIVDVAVDNP